LDTEFLFLFRQFKKTRHLLFLFQHISISYLNLRSEKKLQVPVMAQQKWERRLNRLKVLRNFSPNHRSNDVIVNEDREQLLSARFSYGPLDFVLAGEHIDIFVAKDTAQAEVCFFFNFNKPNRLVSYL
jgi:hypothetical protein